MDLEDGPGAGQGRQQRGRPGEHGTSLERASDTPARRRSHAARRVPAGAAGDERPDGRRGRRGGAGPRLVGAGPRLPRLAARRPRPARGRGTALLGLGGADRAADPAAYPRPRRHPDDELLGWLDAQHAELEAALAGADPAERVWTWAPQQDVAFVLRRQVHEAVVHTVDVEQVLGDVRPIPASLGLDGLDEWLDVMVPGACRTAHPRARTRWCSTRWMPTRGARSSPARGRSRSPPSSGRRVISCSPRGGGCPWRC